MKKNDVCFDAKLIQLLDSFFQIFKEHIIKSGEIKAVFCVSLECISFRICGVVGVEFWENTHSDLVKRSVFQCFQSLLLHLFGLVDPCVAGGSKRLESGAVLVCKMEFIFCYIEVYFLLWKYIFFRAHTSMVACCGWCAEKFTCLAVQLRVAAVCLISPVTFCLRHETDAIFSLIFVKTFYGKLLDSIGKISGKLYILKWISLGCSGKFQVKYFIFFYCFCHNFSLLFENFYALLARFSRSSTICPYSLSSL